MKKNTMLFLAILSVLVSCKSAAPPVTEQEAAGAEETQPPAYLEYPTEDLPETIFEELPPVPGELSEEQTAPLPEQSNDVSESDAVSPEMQDFSEIPEESAEDQEEQTEDDLGSPQEPLYGELQSQPEENLPDDVPLMPYVETAEPLDVFAEESVEAEESAEPFPPVQAEDDLPPVYQLPSQSSAQQGTESDSGQAQLEEETPPVPPAEPAPAREDLPPVPPAPAQESVPPAPPSFLRPAEPVIPPPAREQLPPPIMENIPAVPLNETAFQEAPGSPGSANEGEEIVYSRIVRATVGQVIEIPFRGTGWVYLGEMGNRRGISYDSRRMDIESRTPGSAGIIIGQSFIFSTESAGTYILKFYKQDFIQDYIINDYVQVIVGEAAENSAAGRFSYPADTGRVVAEPRWPPVDVPEPGTAQSNMAQADTQQADTQQAGTQQANTQQEPDTGSPAAVPPDLSPAAETTMRPRQTVPDEGIEMVAPPQAASSAGASGTEIPQDALPIEYIRLARQDFNAGRIEQAISVMDIMKQHFPSGTDEAWWLYGQLLEANSPGRDIRLALEYYRRLIREYPQSTRVPEAQRRISYLERFYFNIR